MRRIPRLIVCVALVTGAATPSAPAQAQELPPGFTDGQPVGGDQAAAEVSPAPAVGTAAATQRYFGQGAYSAVRQAVGATSHSCPITDDGLTALVLAPVFAESSAATTAARAPSPMTLSRYDEWNGVRSTSMGTPENNFGLYAFSSPSTAYRRAFWHPGLGIWQYDTAGLGAPLTTVEAMDVRVVAGAVATEVSRRYCLATGEDASRRNAAWAPWSGCATGRCETFFQEMYSTSPKFASLNLVAGIGPLGGTEQRQCTLDATIVPCWYVEPKVGVIQGATAWATLTPLDGGSTTVAPTPLSHPFYVVDRGTTEERHWLRVDTGYGIDIRARRTIGKDARPRSNQSGSGLTWSSSSGLCDITKVRGECVPVPPAGVSSRALNVTSGYRPVALDADGDGAGDVLWYRPGSGSDALWQGTGPGAFTSNPIVVSSTYDDVLTGDVDGDGDDDVLWYNRSSGASYLWRSRGDGTFASTQLTPGAGRRPLLLDTNGDGDEEIFWYGPGSLSDSLWNWSGSTFSKSARSVSATYQPFVGDFDGNGRDDIFWYAPGAGADFVWLHAANGSTVSVARSVKGTYTPVVGDLEDDDQDDIFWYAPGAAADAIWWGGPRAAFVSAAVEVNGAYTPVVADLTGSGAATVIWYAPGSGSDHQWAWSSTRAHTSRALVLPGFHQPLLGGFSTGGADGVVWYEPNHPTDVIWYR